MERSFWSENLASSVLKGFQCELHVKNLMKQAYVVKKANSQTAMFKTACAYGR